MQYDPEQGLSRIRSAAAIVIGQLGQTLDGKVATVTGESLYINGRYALKHLHDLRAAVDALVVGAGTVALDNPRLTVRLSEGKTPVRVIVDPSGRVSADSQCFQDNEGSVLIIRAKGVLPAVPAPASAEVIEMALDEAGHISPRALCDELAARGLPRVLIEGGPRTLSLAVEAGVVDELHLMVAPKLLGSGKQGFTLPPIEKLDQALSPSCATHVFEDGDVLFACNLRETREVVVGFPSE